MKIILANLATITLNLSRNCQLDSYLVQTIFSTCNIFPLLFSKNEIIH